VFEGNGSLVYDRRPVTASELRRLCLGFNGAIEDFPFGTETSVFKVDGKIFALSALRSRPLSVSLKCEPELASQLRAAHEAIVPGYHLNKRHWNTATLDGSLSDEMVRDMVEDSYDLVVAAMPRRRREALGWSPDQA
jgi:predicted DNA-binding protein (MmcQ/YjbR family)